MLNPCNSYTCDTDVPASLPTNVSQISPENGGSQVSPIPAAAAKIISRDSHDVPLYRLRKLKSANTVERRCLICDTPFVVEAYKLNEGKGRTCSHKCASRLGRKIMAERWTTDPDVSEWEKVNARGLINSRLKRGHIRKPKRCEGCRQVKRLDGHHDDYRNQPDVVRWLCRSCHMKAHIGPRRPSDEQIEAIASALGQEVVIRRTKH